ncbi:MAG: 16S rRNA (guanine(966)-N(2))-methyltransferase RsmD [Acetobacter sp.]|nr:16S rRNA (guanine(966)-N(2))-methyltransferase RsmD [Acetobacter sp.]
MRIIAGTHKGRLLSAPTGKTTRPTADRVRQSLFDTLLHAPWGGRALFENCHVLDAFAGTGALGLEALSRGAKAISFFETNHLALSHLRGNIRACRAEEHCFVFAQDVTKPPQKLPQNIPPATLIFLDPPYYSRLAPHALHVLFRHGWIAPHAIAVLETAHDEILPFGVPPDSVCPTRITRDTSKKRFSQENLKPPPTKPKKTEKQVKQTKQEKLFSLPLSLLTTRHHGAAFLSLWQFEA